MECDIKEEIINLTASEIFREMNMSTYLDMDINNGELFGSVKRLASLTNELFKNKDIKNRFIELANKSIPNGYNNEQKIDTFDMLRHYFNHFPMFRKYEDAYVNKELLYWNRTKKGEIEECFEKYQNKEISFLIMYLKVDGNWKPVKEIKLKIPALPNKEKMYLKNIISLQDIYLTFSMVKYYLNDMGFVVKEDLPYSI